MSDKKHNYLQRLMRIIEIHGLDRMAIEKLRQEMEKEYGLDTLNYCTDINYLAPNDKTKPTPPVEEISSIVHDIWSHWMKHFETTYLDEILPASGKYEIPDKTRFRWHRQMSTKYSDLPEEEKESDRKLAREIINDWEYNPYTGEKL